MLEKKDGKWITSIPMKNDIFRQEISQNYSLRSSFKLDVIVLILLSSLQFLLLHFLLMSEKPHVSFQI